MSAKLEEEFKMRNHSDAYYTAVLKWMRCEAMLYSLVGSGWEHLFYSKDPALSRSERAIRLAMACDDYRNAVQWYLVAKREEGKFSAE